MGFINQLVNPTLIGFHPLFHDHQLVAGDDFPQHLSRETEWKDSSVKTTWDAEMADLSGVFLLVFL